MQERLDLCMVRGQLLMNAAQDSGAAPSTTLNWTREHGWHLIFVYWTF